MSKYLVKYNEKEYIVNGKDRNEVTSNLANALGVTIRSLYGKIQVNKLDRLKKRYCLYNYLGRKLLEASREEMNYFFGKEDNGANSHVSRIYREWNKNHKYLYKNKYVIVESKKEYVLLKDNNFNDEYIVDCNILYQPFSKLQKDLEIGIIEYNDIIDHMLKYYRNVGLEYNYDEKGIISSVSLNGNVIFLIATNENDEYTKLHFRYKSSTIDNEINKYKKA